MIVRRLLQHEAIASRRAFLGGLASAAGALALGGCTGLGAAGARFDASSLSLDPTLLVTTTRKPVNGGRAKPWFGPERASTMTVARAKLVPPDDSRLSLSAVGLGDWRLDGVEPVSGDVSDLLAQAGGGGDRPEMVRREGLGSEARQAQRTPQGQSRGRAQARSHSASHVDRRNRVQLVEEGDCCLASRILRSPLN